MTPTCCFCDGPVSMVVLGPTKDPVPFAFVCLHCAAVLGLLQEGLGSDLAAWDSREVTPFHATVMAMLAVRPAGWRDLLEPADLPDIADVLASVDALLGLEDER